MSEIYDQILEKINEYDKIIIHRHIRPDGDCIGSQVGLKNLILNTYPNKKVLCPKLNDVPDYLEDLVQDDDVNLEDYNGALVIIVDTAAEERIAGENWRQGDYHIKIDHHDNTFDFADLNYVDPETPSCAAILSRMAKYWGDKVVMNPVSAKYFYFGIITDTGRFRYRGVNQEIFEIAGFLLSYGVDIQALYDDLYIDKLETLKLQGYLLCNFKSTPNGVVYMYFTKKMMKKFNVSTTDAGNLVNSLASIEGCPVWVAFIDQCKPKDPKCTDKLVRPENEIRVRLRSRRVAINDIAANFRGGGHLNAAGATIYSKTEMNNLLKELDEAVRVYKLENPNVK